MHDPDYGQGKPYVDEEAGVRRLYFDSVSVQSSMRIADPYALDLSYTETMMGFLPFNPEPRHILIVGLGGGSLSKYCYHHFPRAHITTLEINRDVIALRDEFLIPCDNERFHVLHTDAADYMAKDEKQTDIILLDGYDACGLPDDLCAEAFYSHCWQTLNPEGILVANLWGGGDLDRRIYLERLRGIFDGRVWWSTSRNSTNLIAFAIKSARYCPKWSQLMRIALKLKTYYGLDFPRVIKNLRLRTDPN